MLPRRQWVVRPIAFVLVVVGLYALVRTQRAELVDFAVPYRTAVRFLAQEPLYRPEDGHYQYKYLPAFAVLVAPFTLLARPGADFMWFSLTVAMAWALFRVSLAALPDRRRSERLLLWFTLLLTGKFLVKELALGQFNLPLALLLLGAVIAVRHNHQLTAGAAVATGVFIKPYALVLVPWLAWTTRWRALIALAVVMAGGLALPAALYGWNGNLTLLREWYRTVAETTGPNLLGLENISFASMWAKWLEPGPMASALALGSSIAAVAGGVAIMWRRQSVPEPTYLESAYFFVLIPLLSPQGWDYVLIIALPAYVCLADRWLELSPAWRAAALTGFLLTSFTIFDLLGRPLYTQLMQLAAVSIGAVLIVVCLVRLRWRALA